MVRLRFLERAVDKALDVAFQVPEVQAAFQRGQSIRSVAQTAQGIAGSDLDDEAARIRLRESWLADREALCGAIELLARHRCGYLDDRAYRLLCAFSDDAPVRPIDPVVRDQFVAEAQLGRRSLADGFEQLAALEPRLRDSAVRRVEHGRRTGWGVSRTEFLVGRWADSSVALLNTDLAEDIVIHYRHLTVDGNGPDVQPLTPFFDRTPIPTQGFPRFIVSDSRPRATN